MSRDRVEDEEFTLEEFLDALERKLDSSLRLSTWQDSSYGHFGHWSPEFADAHDVRESRWNLSGVSEVDLFLWELLILDDRVSMADIVEELV